MPQRRSPSNQASHTLWLKAQALSAATGMTTAAAREHLRAQQPRSDTQQQEPPVAKASPFDNYARIRTPEFASWTEGSRYMVWAPNKAGRTPGPLIPTLDNRRA